MFCVANDLGPSDLLALSHVSSYWRAFVLSDKRWAEWFTVRHDAFDPSGGPLKYYV